MEDMENLRKLYLNQTAIEELPSSIDHLQGLQYLSVECCDNLLSLPESISNLRSLKVLRVDCCPKLYKLPENLGSLPSLEELYATYSCSVGCQLPSLSGLCSLRILDIQNSNLSQGAIPNDICCLYSLKLLNLCNCNLIEGGIPSEIYNLSSLQALHLGGNHFSNIPDGLNRLSELRVLDLSHCRKLLRIPEFSPSLQVLNIHSCTSLETLSSPSNPLRSCLLKCFRSLIQDLELGNDIPIEPQVASYLHDGISISIPRSSGISEWIRYPKWGSKVATKLPQNWYKNNDLLGFALFSIHVPPDYESDVFDNQDTWSSESDIESEDGVDNQETPSSEPDNEFEDEIDNQETPSSEPDNESEEEIDDQETPSSEFDNEYVDDIDNQETPSSEPDNESEDEIDNQETLSSESDNKSEDSLDNEHTWSLECELTIGDDDRRFRFEDHVSFQCCCDCDIDDDVPNQVWVTYYPKIIIPKKYASNKRRRLKALFQGFVCGEPVEVEKCGIQLIYAQDDDQKIISRQDDAKRSCGDVEGNPAEETPHKRFKQPQH